ncbi:MAG: hypothetical protein KIT34_02865 [Cyanobacteria bacterium TGS_CYA1]|nr:hypothetical protein [Cyanobacteria bacterium TGS_CYA1]
MISFKIANVPTLFIKAFYAEDVTVILDFVRSARDLRRDDNTDILFIDTPITAKTVDAVEKLTFEGYTVHFKDHHGLEGEATSDRDKLVEVSTKKLQDLLKENCTITVRSKHPACSTLVSPGQFKNALAIIADPDADGLTAAMKAAGIYYDGLDDDAAKLDSEPREQVQGSPLSQLLAKNLAVLPSYDVQNPRERERTQETIFKNWVAAVQGDAKAEAKLQEGVLKYERAVDVARKLAQNAKVIAPGTFLVDVCESPVFDPGTLMIQLEEDPKCQITVMRKDRGPIAALHGVQYSLAVARVYREEVNLQNLVPPDSANNPQRGIISNVSFLLHVNEDAWYEHVLPGLKTRV